jgi:hypothetical protein
LGCRDFRDVFLPGGIGPIENPGVSQIRHLGNQGKIIPSETGGLLPLIVVFVNAGNGNVVPGVVVGLILPNGRFDPSEPDFVGWFLLCHRQSPESALNFVPSSTRLMDSPLHWHRTYKRLIPCAVGTDDFLQQEIVDHP